MAADDLSDFDFTDFWAENPMADRDCTEPPPTGADITEIQEQLGYRLPAAYVTLCRSQNGGAPSNTCHASPSATSWAEDHIAITHLFAIGSTKPLSLGGPCGSAFWPGEWKYPDIGVYFADGPSAGHDMLCLDYRNCGPTGEPRVVHVDQDFDFRITEIAPNFASFIRGLQPEEAYAP